MIIELEKGKNYAVRFYIKDCFGRMKRPYKSGFPSRRAAQQWEVQERARLEGATFSKETITFARLYEEWRGNLVKKDISPRTLEKYDLYHSYIAEYLDHLPLQKINERICQKIIDMRLDSPATCAELRKLMSAAFNYARKKRWMRENPIEFVDVPTYRPKKIPPYDFDDIRTLFSALRSENSKLYTPVLCACLFSATREEVCILQETDIQRMKDGSFRLNLERALITVGGRSIIKTQKTENRRRSFIISATLFEELHRHKTENGIVSPFLCCNRNGSNIQPSTISNSFSKFLAAHSLKKTTFHKLRAAFANSCKRLKIDLDTTYRMMGHSSYKITAEHYASADDVMTADAISRIERALLTES